MRSELFFAVLVLFVSVAGVWYIEMKPLRTAAPTHMAENNAHKDELKVYFAAPASEVRVKRGVHNQFYVTAAVNHWPASFLVDTGASHVAIRESDAAAAGVFTTMTDYTHAVRTANGETKAALVILNSVEIGELKLDDVKAFILPDEQLGMNLLGMSFLSRLKGVEASNGELILKG